MWTRTGTVLTVSSRAMIAACERLGLDTNALLDAAGIPRQKLEDPDARLEAAAVSALWTKAYEQSGDPVLSLHAAEACPLGAYKVIDWIAANATTVGDAFHYAARYFPLINTAIRLPIDDAGDGRPFTARRMMFSRADELRRRDPAAIRMAERPPSPHRPHRIPSRFPRVRGAPRAARPREVR